MSMEKDTPKLDANDVRSIFEALHDNKPAPAGLKFQIVPVGPDGQGLSPPNHEYKDGIYVLLKPDKSKKKKNSRNSLNKHIDSPKIPHHLTHLEMKTPLSNITKWSLSGPQFPRPTAFQQRYCYPQGLSEYARTKGAALWTMYTIDGKEDKEYRILHVYFSTKRANNAGQSVSSLSGKSKKPSKSFKKKEKAKRKLTTTNEGQVTKQQKRSHSRNGIRPKLQGNFGFSPSPRIKGDLVFRPSFADISPNIASMSSETIQHNFSRDGTIHGGLSAHNILPILLNEDDGLDDPNTESISDANDAFCENGYPDVSHEYDNMIGVGLADPPIFRTEATEWASLIDSIDEKSDLAFSFRRTKTFSDILVDKLNVLHQKIIHEWIVSRPCSERGRLVNVVANWAQSVSRFPLQFFSPEEEKNRDGSPYVDEHVNLEMKNEDMAVAI